MIIVFLAGYLAGLATLLVIWLAGYVLGPWARALTSGARVSLMGIVGMRLRRTPPHLVIDAYIRLVKKEMRPTLDQVELQFITNRDKIQTAGDLVYFVTEEIETQTSEPE